MAKTIADDCVVDLTREQLEGKTLAFVRGLAAANIQDLEQPRDYDWTMDNIIIPLMTARHLGDGHRTKFDDRKIRYDGFEIDEEKDRVVVRAGLTHFKAYKADEQRSLTLNAALQVAGRAKFKDTYAFFARPLGVTVLPITLEGSVFIGVRTNEEYGDHLHGAAGYVKCRGTNNNPDILEDQREELLMEFGIEMEESPVLTGISYHPNTGETDISALVRVTLHDDYFTSGRWRDVPNPEHEEQLVQLKTLDEIDELLSTGKVPDGRTYPVLYSTRQALQSVRKEDLVPLNP